MLELLSSWYHSTSSLLLQACQPSSSLQIHHSLPLSLTKLTQKSIISTKQVNYTPVSYNGLSITVFHTVDPGSIPGAGTFPFSNTTQLRGCHIVDIVSVYGTESPGFDSQQPLFFLLLFCWLGLFFGWKGGISIWFGARIEHKGQVKSHFSMQSSFILQKAHQMIPFYHPKHHVTTSFYPNWTQNCSIQQTQ